MKIIYFLEDRVGVIQEVFFLYSNIQELMKNRNVVNDTL